MITGGCKNQTNPNGLVLKAKARLIHLNNVTLQLSFLRYWIDV
jgi:hypothetical protein